MYDSSLHPSLHIGPDPLIGLLNACRVWDVVTHFGSYVQMTGTVRIELHTLQKVILKFYFDRILPHWKIEYIIDAMINL